MLPPEIWRICIRWATLPPSGRSPWDDPRTHLDPWYRRSITQHVANDRSAVSDTIEQMSVYPTKRAVVLVCKAWKQIATEYLYEHVVCGVLGCSALITILQSGAKGEQLARLVIRVDIPGTGEAHQLQSTFLQICPNLQSIYLTAFPVFHPAPYSSERRNLPIVSISPDLLQTPGYEPFWSAANHWRYLTIHFGIHELNENPLMPITQRNILPPPPHSNGKEFLNLKHIFFTSRSGSRYSIRNLSHWPLPSLTHLTINSYFPVGREYDDILDALQASQLGPRLKFFALLVHDRTSPYNTTISGSLALLKAMPNLEEIALPFFWVSVPAPTMAVTLSGVHTVGMETERRDYPPGDTEKAFATYVEICCRLFPNRRKIRTLATTSLHTVSYFFTMEDGPMPMLLLKTAAAVLKERGIKFEDCAGWDITQMWD